ncbi:hypothetical protein IAI18_15200 [Acetobacteraceae bacterium H6797]|nr:hypothetical protein [Acetobacteraceae bacterium H6797]
MPTHGLPTWPWADSVTDDLPAPEALLLEGMRRWETAAREGMPALPCASPPFITEDLGAAAVWLDLMLLTTRRERELRFSRVEDPVLAEDEAALLLACAMAQRGSRPQALAAFCRLLPPLAAYSAMGHALRLGAVLRRAGWFMTPLPRG